MAARNRLRFGLSKQNEESSTAKPVSLSAKDKKKEEIELKYIEDREHLRLKKNRMLGDLMTEMKEYDKSILSTIMVERMEKVLTS